MFKMKVVLKYFIYFLCVQSAFTLTNQHQTSDSIELTKKAKNYIINQIQPEIEELFKILNVEMDKMAKETIALEQRTTKEIQRKKELEEKLQKTVKSQKIVNDIGKVATVASTASNAINVASEWIGMKIPKLDVKNKFVSKMGKINDFVAQKSERASEVLTMVSSLYSVFSYFSNDDAVVELNEVSKAVQRDRETLKALTAFKDQIYNKLTPLLDAMRINLKNLSNNLTFKMLVALDIQKTKLAPILRDIQKRFASLLHSFGSEHQVENSLQQIEESMDLFINIYDRVQSYLEQTKFAISMSELQ